MNRNPNPEPRKTMETAVIEIEPTVQAEALMRLVPLELLSEHPENPRQHFEPRSLAELVESIREHGMLNPILVRPLNGHGFQVLGGHRRFRAARMLPLEEVPVIVRELNDTAALEIVVIDNLEREDLHPLEEASGFVSLMTSAGYDIGRISARIQKSTKYVYDRIKLLQLIPELRKVLLDGEISAGHAILLARLSPADQKRAIGKAEYDSWIFQTEHADCVPGLDLEDQRRRKPFSVRELESNINSHVRLKIDDAELPTLFPETAVALAGAEAEDLEVVRISHRHHLEDARGKGELVYLRREWKRADGGLDASDGWGRPKRSKKCGHAALGVVVAGPGRGDSFRVCVASKECKVHWAAEIKEAQEREKPGTRSSSLSANHSAQQKRWQEEERRRKEREARWKKATPRILEVLAEKLKTTPALKLMDVVINAANPQYSGRMPPKHLARGRTVEDGIRYAAFLALTGIVSSWHGSAEAPKALKPLGVDTKKIVAEAAKAPKEKKAAKASAKKNGKPTAAAKKKPATAKKEVPPQAAGSVDELVRAALQEDPKLDVLALYDRISSQHPEVGKLTPRQFHSRHVLPIKRKGLGARARRRTKRAQTSAQSETVRSCRVCGCTEEDCRQCIERTGEPCSWVEQDLCSACAADAGEGQAE